MAHDRKVVNLKNQISPQRFTLPAALMRLRDVAGQSLRAVMSAFFDQADDALFELADKAATNQDQAAYFDAMRELRLRRKNMTVCVLQYVSSAFNEIGQFSPKASAGSLDQVDQESLSLLDHSQLEQQVAVDNLINKLRSQNAEAIRLLNARIVHLIPNIKLDISQMPLSPEVICGGLSEACADLDIDIRAKLVVLKLFDRLLGGILGDFYINANRTLISEGVLPNMKRPPVAGHKTQTQGTGRPGVSRSIGKEGEDSGGESRQDASIHSGDVRATFSELSALLHGNHQGPVDDGPGMGPTAVLDTDTLMARLNNIQAESASWNPGESVSDIVSLTEQLQSLLVNERGEPVSAAQVDNDVINLVSMLFDFILEDRHLHSTMKAIISRLQIPVLKVALSDKNFFNRGGHPVRKLLNELALAAVGWTEKKSGQRDPLRAKIESVVERVLNEYRDDVGLFNELLDDFGHYVDLDRRRRELVEQRLRDAEEGRARHEQAVRASGDLLTELQSGHQLPQPVVKLLNDALAKYLQWVVLREGAGSDQWHQARRLAENLVWSVDPSPVTEDTRGELLRIIPRIVDDLRSALQEISWDPFATDAAIRDLELAHVDVFQRLETTRKKQPETQRERASDSAPAADNAPVVDSAPDIISAPENAVSEVSAEASTEVIAPYWLKQAENLRVGSWIEMTRDSNKTRCKLAAFIKATGKYIFVNRSGAKVAEYQRESLAKALETDEITMLDDGLIFDRALESIIDNLRNSRRD